MCVCGYDIAFSFAGLAYFSTYSRVLLDFAFSKDEPSGEHLSSRTSGLGSDEAGFATSHDGFDRGDGH